MSKYAEEIDDLEGFDAGKIWRFYGVAGRHSGRAGKAKDQNLAQAQLKQNLLALRESTYQLARKVSDLIP